MDITVLREAMPIIEINFEELKGELLNKLDEYTGLVVTEETLGACKDAQKELASLRVKIDTYRKDKKKELSEPITKFEGLCKELIACVEKVEKPIKEGIDVFDNQRREEKIQIALQLIDAVAAETGLNDEYKAQLTVLDKYTNLTAKNSDVKVDLDNRAFALRVEQDRKQEMLDTLQTFIDMENATLSSPMCLKDFDYNIRSGQTLPELITAVRNMGEKLRMAESSAKEEKPVNEPSDAPQEVSANEDLYEVCFKVRGTATQMRKLSAFLQGYDYQTMSQEKLS